MAFSGSAALAGALFGLQGWALGLSMVPWFSALRSLVVVRGGERLTLRGLDASAISTAGWLLSCAPALAGFGLPAAAFASGCALVLALSFRLRVDATPSRTIVRRYFLWIVRWRRVEHPGGATAFVDGWGDFADPESISLRFESGRSFELAWVSRGEGHLRDAVVAAFDAPGAAAGT
ncbi:MAG: hypothetical protein ACOZQL_40250 [Myxococcota bacterium]